MNESISIDWSFCGQFVRIDRNVLILADLITGDNLTAGHLAVFGTGLLITNSVAALFMKPIQLNVIVTTVRNGKRFHRYRNEREFEITFPSRT